MLGISPPAEQQALVATAIGFATGFVGLVVILPLAGHLTWHAYRESVAPWG